MEHGATHAAPAPSVTSHSQTPSRLHSQAQVQPTSSASCTSRRPVVLTDPSIPHSHRHIIRGPSTIRHTIHDVPASKIAGHVVLEPEPEAQPQPVTDIHTYTHTHSQNKPVAGRR